MHSCDTGFGIRGFKIDIILLGGASETLHPSFMLTTISLPKAFEGCFIVVGNVKPILYGIMVDMSQKKA